MAQAPKKLLEAEVWEKIRHAHLLERRSALWISNQQWAPSRPTVMRAINAGLSVRDVRGNVHKKPAIKTLEPSVQSAMRASEGAARVLAVVQAAGAGNGEAAAELAGQPLPMPAPARRLPAGRPPGATDQNEARAEVMPEPTGVTPETVLRELAHIDGAQTLAEETAMMREGKETAHDLLLLARSMVADGRAIHAKITAALGKIEILTPMDVLVAVKINSAIALTTDRATRVAERVMQLERELLGDPRDATGATGAPGETFAMSNEEALAELRRCSHVAERYGVTFAVGSLAELPAVVTNQQDIREEAPSVFVAARDDEQDDEPQQTAT